MNTDYKNIDNILNRYFDGLTGLDEEKLLQKYFSSEAVRAEHNPYKALFQYVTEAKKQRNPKPVKLTETYRRNYRFYYAASVALLIGFSLVWFLQYNHKNQLELNDVATHVNGASQNKEKKKEAEKELKKFSKSVQKGLESVNSISIFGSTTKKVFNLKNENK